MAKKRYPRSDSIESMSSNINEAYVSWGGDETSRKAAFRAMAGAVDEYDVVQNSSASYYGGRPNNYYSGRHYDFSNLDTNTSGRPGLTKQGYYAFRPHEAPPVRLKHIIQHADDIYQHVGLVRNVIDLMGDFTSQGIRIVHPNKRIEKFHQNWWKRVKGAERSERFANLLYRRGNVVVRRQTARISTNVEKELYKSAANPDVKPDKIQISKREIPWRYVFLDPSTVEVVGGALASFVGRPTYAIKLPLTLRKMIQKPRGGAERALVSKLPAEILAAARTNKPIPLPDDKTEVYFYKKDDWLPWAYPMIYAIMDDISLLEKLKLADMAALDGAISNIRIFKLGNLEARIAPTRAAVAKLASILGNHTSVGTLDLIWGPDIELVESKTTVHQFLGDKKYQPTLNNIYAGLGIPPTLTGTFGAAGTTNNFISLKTLIQRLEYGRQVLKAFWEKELVILQKAMGFRFPAKVEFTHNNLGDEIAEKALLIQLADRNMMSEELIQHHFGSDPEMEQIRTRREQKERDNGTRVPKAGAWHDPQFELALKKVALQSGVVTPSQVGLDLPKPKKGEQPALKMKQPPGGGANKPPTKKKGQPQSGRPNNSKDSKTRKTKTFKPKTKAMWSQAVTEVWANAALVAIADVVDDGLLEHYGKKNLRSLTAKQHEEAEMIKFGVLCNLEPMGILDEKAIVAALNSGGVPVAAKKTYETWTSEVTQELGRPLKVDELRKLKASVYATILGEN